MIKLILIIVIALLFFFFGYSFLKSDEPTVNLPGSNKPSSPSDAIEGARDAVQQSQDVQNKVNNYADELNR